MRRLHDPAREWFAGLAELHGRLAEMYGQMAAGADGRIVGGLAGAAPSGRNGSPAGSAGSSTGDLDPLGEREAECRSPGREPEAKDPMSTTKPTVLLTRSEVADLLRIDERTLARLRNDPKAKFPRPMKRTRALRWRRADVEAWLEMRR